MVNESSDIYSFLARGLQPPRPAGEVKGMVGSRRGKSILCFYIF
jgi:hypothetical protein